MPVCGGRTAGNGRLGVIVVASSVLWRRPRVFFCGLSILWIGLIGFMKVPDILEYRGPLNSVDIPNYILYPEMEGTQDWAVAVASGALEREAAPGWLFVLGDELHAGIVSKVRRWNSMAIGTDEDVSHFIQVLILKEVAIETDFYQRRTIALSLRTLAYALGPPVMALMLAIIFKHAKLRNLRQAIGR